MTTSPLSSSAARIATRPNQTPTRDAPHQRRAGSRAASHEPAWGWQARSEPTADGMSNPRPPAVPATLHLTLHQYYAAAALIGLLGSQKDEPNQAWAAKWACEMGEKMAKECKKRKWHPKHQ